MGRPDKQGNSTKADAHKKGGKPGKQGGSKQNADSKFGEKILLVNMPGKKQGKFKKDFGKNMDKLIAEMGLYPDETGKIKFSKEKKIESMENYGKASFNTERYQKTTKHTQGETFIFKQNLMKKPTTNSKKELIKVIEREKKKKKEILFEGDQEIDDDMMDEFFDMMKKSQHYGVKLQIRSAGLGKYKKDGKEGGFKGKFEGNGKEEGKKKDAFGKYDEYMDLEEVQKGLEDKSLYQGIFIMNEKNMANCFIKCPEIEERVYFKDQVLRNRALHNAIVVFQITKGKPTPVAEKAESITDYEAKHIELDEPIENYQNPVEEYEQGIPSGEDKQGIEGEDSEEDEEEEGEFEDEDDEEEEDEEEDEDDESEEEKEMNDYLDKKEAKIYGMMDDDDDDDEEDVKSRDTPPIDDSVSDDDEDIDIDLGNVDFAPLKKLDKKKKNKPMKKKNNFRKTSDEKEEEKVKKEGFKNRVFGKIVYIVDNPEFSRKFVCTLRKPLPGMQGGIPFACPIERKLPLMLITSVHKEISSEASKYYLAEFIYWPNDSKFPHGHIIEEIGDMGLIDIESEALLKNYNVYNEEFTEESYDYLKAFEAQSNPLTKEYIIPQEEREKREDMTKKIVFTCDPVTARDLDDALSITHIREDIYEIGVHIADVSHFVKEGTPLDDDARLRTTSVYLVHKVIPMLPRLLCENLCSLNPGVERLTFSVFFWAKEDGTIIESQPPRITKSIIKTCAKLNYDIVQDIIDGKITSAKDLPLVYIPENVDPEQVITDSLRMNTIAQNIRKKRFDNGSMSFEREKKRFQLDEACYPISYRGDTRKQSNFMVEEYMLLANQKVGRYIVETCQEIGLLRCHPPPGNIKINALEQLLGRLDLTMRFESSKAIQESSAEIFNNPQVSENYKAIVKYRMCKILEAAKYFVVEQTPLNEWRHFALNFDVYTHFTSPIRRYPDVLVHRLLEKCLIYKKDVKEQVNKYHMLAIMDKCNECKINSKRVSDASEKLFMCLYLKKNPTFTKAIILGCFSACIEIYIPLIETEKKIFWKDFKSYKKAEQIEEQPRKVVKVGFAVEDKPDVDIVFKEFESCEIYIQGTDSFPVDFKIHFVHEFVPGEKTILL